jgi:urease accessory protein UreF
MRLTSKQLALDEAADWLGDWHPLADQLGSADGLVTLASVAAMLSLPPVTDTRALRFFIHRYRAEVLLPFELPAIQVACGHAGRHELRELVALDARLSGEPLLQSISEASRRVGRSQLQKLRPLRDDRMVQRYLNAVESGQASGWHTLVYGLTLAVYSLPLRQGLLGYAHQTIRSFIYTAAHLLELSEHECRALFDELCADLPSLVDQLVREADRGLCEVTKPRAGEVNGLGPATD